MPNGELVKAVINNLDTNDSVECMFNPKEYTFTKENKWNFVDRKGSNLPSPEFKSGQPTTLKMQLFFDTYTTGEDVRQTTNRIWKLMNINERLTDMTSAKG